MAVAAQALGGNAWELSRLPEPERSYWIYRGILKNNAEVEAQNEDELDRQSAPRM